MSRPLPPTRSHAVQRLRRHLEQASHPRVQMAFIVALTGAAGLLFSFLLLQAGVHHMALRYPLALALAYLFFLFLLWLWLRSRDEDPLDGLGDLGGGGPDLHMDGGPAAMRSGGGGDFGGGGASGRFDAAVTHTDPNGPTSLPDPLPSLSDVGDADEATIPLVALGLALGLALASFYVVYLAPVLFAELLLDGVLSYTLYRRLRQAERRHWLTTAVYRTALPFALTAVFLVVVGAALSAWAPGAHSLGEAVRQLRMH